MNTYTKIRLQYSWDKERFYRIIAVKDNPNLRDLGVMIGCALRCEFEHLFLFHANKKSYVSNAFLENYGLDNWVSYNDYYLSDLSQKFIYEYDTGDGWEFEGFIYKRKMMLDNEEPVLILEGAGQGIWEDNRYSLDYYLNGTINPHSNGEDLEECFSLPWNFDNEYFKDFDKPFNLEIENKESFGKLEKTLQSFKENENKDFYELNDEDDDIDLKDYITGSIFDALQQQIENVDYVHEAYMRLLENHDDEYARLALIEIFLLELLNPQNQQPFNLKRFKEVIESMEQKVN